MPLLVLASPQNTNLHWHLRYRTFLLWIKRPRALLVEWSLDSFFYNCCYGHDTSSMLNNTPEEEDTRRRWRLRVYEHSTPVHFTLRRWLRGGVNRWVYFSYRRRLYTKIFPIILFVSVSPDYYEGQGWLRNPQCQPSFYGIKSYFEFAICSTPRSICTKVRDDFRIFR